MKVTIIEVDGSDPISEWLKRKLKDYIYVQSGLEVSIEMSPVPNAAVESAEMKVGPYADGR